jgi:hypothetical protein
LILLSCKTINYDISGKNEKVFTSVKIDTLFQDKISIRALVFDANKVWYAADKSRFGFFDLDKNQKKRATYYEG